MEKTSVSVCCAVAFFFICSAAGARDAGGICQGAQPVTLTGTVRSLVMIQEEPAETPQSVFTLELRRPWCGETAVFASMPGPLLCFDGDFATFTGDYFPPVSGFPGGPIFEARKVVGCGR